MESRDMVRMANQMAAFFKPYGDVEGTRELATHINNFWAPPMRREFFEYIAQGGKDFAPMVLAAAAQVRKPKGETV
jgi:formate dehydrogenase subunit delta